MCTEIPFEPPYILFRRSGKNTKKYKQILNHHSFSANNTKCLTPLVTISGVKWSPAGCASNGGCVLATCTTDNKVVIWDRPVRNSAYSYHWAPVHDATADLQSHNQVGRETVTQPPTPASL